MFIGDGGTLVMGTVMSVFVIAILQSGSRVAAFVDPNVGLVPFTLAVLSVPVFDTLRVMSTRMLKGLVAIPSRQDPPAPYVHRHGLFPCRDDIGYLGIEYGGRVMLVGVRSGRFFNRRSTVMRSSAWVFWPRSGCIISCSGISAATRNSWALFAGWVTRLISAVPIFFSGCSRLWIKYEIVNTKYL